MLVVAVFALLAQQPPQIPPDSLRRDTTRLESITVRGSASRAHRYAAPFSSTAAKIALPLRDTPASVSIITSALIRDQSMQNMADALRYVPGVTMGQGEGHRDAPTIRGNSSTADFFVDGTRDDVQYFRDLYNVERIEALGGSNAMTFGRGGGGGVINRVSKRAQWEVTRDLTLEGGSFAHGRGTLDIGGPITHALALRLNGMYQHSGAFRDAGNLARYGASPQVAYAFSDRTLARLGGEYFQDDRTVDRGLPSFGGGPAAVPHSRFFGNPDSSYAHALVRGLDAGIEHRASDRLTLRSQSRATVYDKFYQNVYPSSAVNAAGTRVNLGGYNNNTDRTNLFTQNEATLRLASARVPQTILVGVELGRQVTDNFRATGYFNGTATSLDVSVDSATVTTPVEFRQSASDANNRARAHVVSLYAQDHVTLAAKLQATLGVRFERFDLHFRDNRSASVLERRDDVLSPRVGLVYKPLAPVSIYSSYSVSHLPSAGDQFSSLTVTTQTLEPERFTNREIGAKWDVRPELSLSTAAYQLLRSNSAAPSALDPGVTVQTGAQETLGFELSLSGRVSRAWDVVGSFSTQRAEITSQTGAAPAGAVVPLVPRHTFSLWNRFQPLRTVGFGLGTVHQSAMFAAIDNTVTLPGFWRFDAAAYVTALRNVKLQLNVENLLDRRYFATSHGNNNIMPGAPLTIRASMTTLLQ
ncbi:MAG: TonB-dependent siderophore receptor [Gemmatimonadaceae bacterium]